MKNILFLVLLFPLISFSQMDVAFDHDLDWKTDYNKAINIARKQKKNVLVYFTGSDWCTPCKKLKVDLFNTEDFKAISENYILLYIDVPRNTDLLSTQQLKHNKDMLPKYNKKGVFPLLKVLDSRGKEIDDISGYSMTGDVQYHLKFLKKNI